MNELFTPTLLATVLFKIVHLYLISFEIHAITMISKLAVFIFMMHMGDDIDFLFSSAHMGVILCEGEREFLIQVGMDVGGGQIKVRQAKFL